ncbi:RRNA processing protein [Spiromyces aspiralis]|uniref:rRNA processing protein n=1 Tax=Spiromyces aspiralis TaxID=68401 RepID=A0ACC1HA41_9FUNG|nr:RRNA processing protein [Spiromyces aspiralis]
MDALREEMELKDLPWIETCTITSSEPIIIEDANNDLDRELAFYNQALEAAKAGREGVLKANVPFTRPDDYFAEMLKSDEHMERVRRKLIEEQKSIKNAEEAKKQRMLKKYGKKIQQEKLKERQEKKKQTLEKIKSLKQSKYPAIGIPRAQHGSVDSGDLLNNDFEDQFDVALADSDNENGGGKKRKGGDGKAYQPNPKRQAKNKRYGMGGKKRGLKQNTSNSVDDISGFSHKKMKANVFGGKKGGKGKRPGKAVRQKMRNKK